MTEQPVITRAKSGLSSPTVRTLALVVGLFAATLVALPHVVAASAVHHGLMFPWWAVAAGFAVAELTVFHLEMYRETHSFTFSEVPLVVALVFAGPVALIVGRLVGE